MKLIFLGLLCSAWFAHASAQASLNPAYEALAGIIKQVTVGVLELLEGQLQELNLEGGNVRFPVLPNFTDPWILNDTELTFTNALLNGEFMSRDNIINGLSTLIDNAVVVPIVLPPSAIVTYRLDLSEASIGGFYETDLDILSGASKFVGSGDYLIQLTHGFVDLNVRLRIFGLLLNKIEITVLEVDLGFDDLNLDIQGATFNGVEPNWTEINPELRRLFDIYWPVLNAKIVPIAKNIVNHLIKTCTIAQLVALELECLNDEPLPEVTSAPEQTGPVQSTTTGSEQTGPVESTTTGSEETPTSSEPVEESTPNSAPVAVVSAIALLSIMWPVLL